MKTIIEYTEADKDTVLADNSNLTLIEIRNLVEGNFFVFSDNPTEDTKQEIYVTVNQKDLDGQFSELKQQQSQLSEDFQGLTDYLAQTGVL